MPFYGKLAPMKQVTVEVKKNQNENNASLLRRFSRRMQESGTLPKVKSIRYSNRPKSKLATKNATLKRIKRNKANDKLRKLGKLVEREKRGR